MEHSRNVQPSFYVPTLRWGCLPGSVKRSITPEQNIRQFLANPLPAMDNIITINIRSFTTTGGRSCKSLHSNFASSIPDHSLQPRHTDCRSLLRPSRHVEACDNWDGANTLMTVPASLHQEDSVDIMVHTKHDKLKCLPQQKKTVILSWAKP